MYVKSYLKLIVITACSTVYGINQPKTAQMNRDHACLYYYDEQLLQIIIFILHPYIIHEVNYKDLIPTLLLLMQLRRLKCMISLTYGI